jgi:surface polysaccharide O-acyltransferase-like enzyme
VPVPRIQSVDVIRVIAICAVIVIHTTPFNSKTVPLGTVFDLALVTNQLARFAVPCFFVLAGFFWATKFEDGESAWKPTRKMLCRVSMLFLVWSALYLLPTDLFGAIRGGPLGTLKVICWNIEKALEDPLATLLEGTKVHLWFLAALVSCLVISAAMLSRNMKRGLIALSLILFVTALLGKPYADTPIGFHVAFNFRDGPFFGLLFFVAGYLLERKGPRKSWLIYGLLLAALGSCLHLAELAALSHFWGTSMLQDYVAGTCLSGIGVAMIALSGSRFVSQPALSRLGPFVPGLYVIHFAFVELLFPLDVRFSGTLMWSCLYPVLVFVFSALAVWALSQNRITKLFVS